MMLRRPFLVLLAAIISFCSVKTVFGNVIGIDMASDCLKVAIVQPGTPLEIVTNFQSKRKTPVCVAFYKGERLFGSDGTALMGRKPDSSFSRLFRAVGRTIDHPHVQEFKKQYFPYEFYTNQTTGLTTLKVDETNYTPEEIVAMMLQNVKDMTKSFGGHNIKDCVITVPSSFTQHERNAIYTAAEIADLKVLSLIEENTAAALNYATDRTFDQPTNVLYYNMGAGATQVTIVNYSSYVAKEGSKNKTVGQFEVVGKAWDDNLGGFHFDMKLTELLADRFNEVWNKKASGKGKDLRDFIRPMTRLRIEANKVKEVLSANQEFPIRAEQLHADVDLITKITRNDFEEACKDILNKLTLPIERALQMANLTLQDIHQVEVLGGSTRIPKVKKVLEEYFTVGNLIVGHHLNGDEAMALGAAFRAANLSTAFRVRKVGMTELTSFAINVRLEALAKDVAGEVTTDGEETTSASNAWQKYTTLYPAQTTLPTKTKTLAFTTSNDILCKLEYPNPSSSSSSSNSEDINSDDASGSESINAFSHLNGLPAGTHNIFAVYNITGVSAFAQEVIDKNISASAPKVHLSFAFDHSGNIHLVKAEATVDYLLPETPVVVESNTTTTSDTTATTGADTNTTATTEDSNNTTTATATPSDANNTSTIQLKNSRRSILRRVLVVNNNHQGLVPPTWTPEMITAAKERLQILDAEDSARKAKAAAMNDLEAYLYKVKNRLLDEETQLATISTDEQRQAVTDLANELEDWLYDSSSKDQVVSVYKQKQDNLKGLAEPIFHRFKEITARKESINNAKKALEEVKNNVHNVWPEKLPHITTEEIQEVLDHVTKIEQWISDKITAQEKHSAFEKPVFDSVEVMVQLKPLRVVYERLLKKPKPVPPKVEETDAEEEEASASEEAATEETTTPTSDDANTATDESASNSTEQATTGDEPIKVKIDPESFAKKKKQEKQQQKTSGSKKSSKSNTKAKTTNKSSKTKQQGSKTSKKTDTTSEKTDSTKQDL